MLDAMMPTTGIVSIQFHGRLKRLFGETIEIFAPNAAKALALIEANFPGKFFQALRKGYYKTWLDSGSGPIFGLNDPEHFMLGGRASVLHIMPSVDGSGKGGVMAILGVALMGVAIVATGGLAAGGLGAAFSGLAGTGWGMVAQFGLGLALSGVGMMLTPLPKMDANADSDRRSSYLYSGVINTVFEGGAIPVCYGAPYVGSIVISAGLSVEQTAG